MEYKQVLIFKALNAKYVRNLLSLKHELPAMK